MRLELETVKPPGMSMEDWLSQQFTKINEASRVDIANDSAQGMTVTNFTENRALDCTGSTLDQVRKALGTLIRFMQQGAPSRSE